MIDLETVFGVLAVISFAPVLLVPVLVFLKRRSYGQLVVVAWVSLFLWAVVNSLLVPLIWYGLGYPEADLVSMEGNAVVAAVMGGWLFGLKLAVIVWILRWLMVAISKVVNLVKKPKGVPEVMGK